METRPIPIENVYYLLCYAWNHLNISGLARIKHLEQHNVANLLARLLLSGLTSLLKRGLHREYVETVEEIPGIKGRVNFAESISRMSFIRAQAVCQNDELSHNIIHNQIIRATIRRMIKTPAIQKQYRLELKKTYRAMGNVDDICLDIDTFQRALVHRNNKHYGFLLHICELIWLSLLPSEEPGEYCFADLLGNRAEMARLFEAFVRNFYKAELKAFDVRAECIPWNATALDALSASHLPDMRSDVSLTSKELGKKIILDTKFYEEALSPKKFSSSENHSINNHNRAVRSDHLYQLLTYITNSAIRNPAYTHEGILLYPTNGADFCFRWVIHGYTITARTINLKQKWSDIHSDLIKICTSPHLEDPYEQAQQKFGF